jgi:23S rRNA pseudouridine1911/1915/1917 synthase
MLKENSLKIYVSHDDVGQRLDKFIVAKIPTLSRSRVQNLLENSHITVHPERVILASTKVKIEEIYTIEIPEPEPAIPSPQEVNMDIVYEDDDLLVINKPAGLVVHPAPGHADHTLVNGILAHCGDQLSGIGGVKRPGIVHRLDKDTSGLMVVAKNDETHHHLCEQFGSRSLKRTYHALVWGQVIPKEGQIHTLMGRSPRNRQKMAVVNRGGKEAVTQYRVLRTFPCERNLTASITLMECQLKTGRTHQIRVHLAHIGHAILGDPLYGHHPKGAHKYWPENLLTISRQFLHACRLEFIHPRTKSVVCFESPYPDDIANIIICVENYI